jgi:hypothetical protein
MGEWQPRHLASITVFRLGVAAISTETSARKRGSRAAFAMGEAFHRS